MVFVQLLPLEAGGFAEDIDKIDEELQKVVVLRGVKEKVRAPYYAPGDGRFPPCK